MWRCEARSRVAENRLDSTSNGLDAAAPLGSYFCRGGHLQKPPNLKIHVGTWHSAGNLVPAAKHKFPAWLEVHRSSIGL